MAKNFMAILTISADDEITQGGFTTNDDARRAVNLVKNFAFYVRGAVNQFVAELPSIIADCCENSDPHRNDRQIDFVANALLSVLDVKFSTGIVTSQTTQGD